MNHACTICKSLIQPSHPAQRTSDVGDLLGRRYSVARAGAPLQPGAAPTRKGATLLEVTS